MCLLGYRQLAPADQCPSEPGNVGRGGPLKKPTKVPRASSCSALVGVLGLATAPAVPPGVYPSTPSRRPPAPARTACLSRVRWSPRWRGVHGPGRIGPAPVEPAEAEVAVGDFGAQAKLLGRACRPVRSAYQEVEHRLSNLHASARSIPSPISVKVACARCRSLRSPIRCPISMYVIPSS